MRQQVPAVVPAGQLPAALGALNGTNAHVIELPAIEKLPIVPGDGIGRGKTLLNVAPVPEQLTVTCAAAVEKVQVIAGLVAGAEALITGLRLTAPGGGAWACAMAPTVATKRQTRRTE
jgi:hypothetical protein